MLKNFCDRFMEFDNQAMLLIRSFLQKKNNSLLNEWRFILHYVVIPFTISRLVYPKKTTSGGYADMLLTTYCLHNMIYNQTTDSCVY